MQPFALRRGQPSEDTPLTVIGVVADIRLRRDEAARPEIYLPLAQHFRSRFNIVARAVEGSAAPDLLRTVAAVNPNLPIVSARSLDEVLTVNQLPQRITAAVASTLGLVGLLLAALGIYGVTAYLVATRTRELGIRMALGASRPRVVALVLTQACGLVLFGGALGVLVSIGALTTLASTAFGFPSGDVVSFAISFALMALAALIACLVPARHATALDPVATLRCD
jgi:hypothetical protein